MTMLLSNHLLRTDKFADAGQHPSSSTSSFVVAAAVVAAARSVIVVAASSSRLTHSGTGPVLWSGAAGGRARLVTSTAAPDVVELWDWTLGPGDRHASDAHANGTQELLHVLEGALVVEIAEQAVTLQIGDALSFPGNVPHAYANPAASPARFSLSVFEPAVGAPHRTRTSHA